MKIEEAVQHLLEGKSLWNGKHEFRLSQSIFEIHMQSGEWQVPRQCPKLIGQLLTQPWFFTEPFNITVALSRARRGLQSKSLHDGAVLTGVGCKPVWLSTGREAVFTTDQAELPWTFTE